MAVKFSEAAEHDLENLIDYLGSEGVDPDQAVAFIEGLRARTESLLIFPRMGKASERVTGTLELVLAPTEYVFVYEVDAGGGVMILRCLHGAQKFPK